ncbi:MAG TPA: hypothetical protein K8V91_04770 [[Clostridium] spiroforme]|uniref:Uncharacterized protein n=1 Tax=Thomasclavelia spiroformis TaxID=29348 RepID=A0A921G9K5_9FIRM|nr:hypothetical protein [Thomasclavelia spiroformis]
MNELNEIIKALKVIQDICEKHYHCADCPLRKDESDCSLREGDIPKNWTLYDPQNIKLIL